MPTATGVLMALLHKYPIDQNCVLMPTATGVRATKMEVNVDDQAPLRNSRWKSCQSLQTFRWIIDFVLIIIVITIMILILIIMMFRAFVCEQAASPNALARELRGRRLDLWRGRKHISFLYRVVFFTGPAKKMAKCQITCKCLQKSSKCQNFRVWHLVIFKAVQSKKPPCTNIYSDC